MAPPFSKPHIEPCLKRLRVIFGGGWIVDTKSSKLVWEHAYYPTYFFNSGDINKEYLRPSTSDSEDAKKVHLLPKAPEASNTGNQEYYDVVVGEKVAKRAVIKYLDGAGDLAGFSKIEFSLMEAWFEEDEQIFVHPKDPYKRVDVLQSSRHIRVEVDGVEIANTHKPRLLFETGLPIRTYIPKTDCRLDLLEPTDLTTECPYKGVASYYSVRLPDSGKIVDNIVWWYRSPLSDCVGIKGFNAFYDEKVDVWVDGEKQTRPQTIFS